MRPESRKEHCPLPHFDPQAGEIVLEPEAPGSGYWVGAPAIVRDDDRGSFLLCYRRRRPRGEQPDRGYESVIAESADGLTFTPIARVTKDDLRTTSIEKCCIARGPAGEYLWLISYVDPEDSRWRIDVVEADRPEDLDPSRRCPALTAESASRSHSLPVEGVKDPNVYRIGGVYHMLLSFAEARPQSERDAGRLHGSSDVYNTGLLVAPSALATSVDGRDWSWAGRILDVGDSSRWDRYQARLNSVLRRDGAWIGFYDGSASHEENYEERFGLAVSTDLRSWTRLTPTAPAVAVPWASGSVRYTDALPVGDELWLYYEVARPDGSHELRRVVLPGAVT